MAVVPPPTGLKPSHRTALPLIIKPIGSCTISHTLRKTNAVKYYRKILGIALIRLILNLKDIDGLTCVDMFTNLHGASCVVLANPQGRKPIARAWAQFSRARVKDTRPAESVYYHTDWHGVT